MGEGLLPDNEGMISNSRYRESHKSQQHWYGSKHYTLTEPKDPKGSYNAKKEVREIVRNHALSFLRFGAS